MIALIQDASPLFLSLIPAFYSYSSERLAYGAALACGSCLRLLDSTSRTDKIAASYFPTVVKRSVTGMSANAPTLRWTLIEQTG
jgi:hypothetical protein